MSENRVVVVTGGGRGLGLAIVRTCWSMGIPSRLAAGAQAETFNSRENRVFWRACQIGREVEEGARPSRSGRGTARFSVW
jgi:NAD(P)-dependent dehydrogenase (short-subunit alcohol dehydrogenase family)